MLARNGGTLNASFSAVEEGVPPHWRPYFTVESTEAAVERACELGGDEVLAPLEIFDGSIALARDPQGAAVRALRRRGRPVIVESGVRAGTAT